MNIGSSAAEHVDPKAAAAGPTPRRLFLSRYAETPFRDLNAWRSRLDAARVGVIFAYSTKTNPDERLLAIARARGWWAEAISPSEVAAVRRAGFAPEHTIYNGPLQPPQDERFAFRFADSIEAYESGDAGAAVLGVRLRPAMIDSRFGIPVDDDEDLVGAVRAGRRPQIAVSMHVTRSQLHGATWRDACDDVLLRAVQLQAQTGTAVVAFDAGGGWDASAGIESTIGDLRWLVGRVAEMLPHARHVIAEPGQAVTAASEALVARITEVRARPGRIEAVSDLGYEDWPDQHGFVHPLFIARRGRWEPLGRGGDRLLGATCLEYDLIEGLRFPRDLVPGDVLLVTGAGSYDSSMAFAFAHGEGRAAEAVA